MYTYFKIRSNFFSTIFNQILNNFSETSRLNFLVNAYTAESEERYVETVADQTKDEIGKKETSISQNEAGTSKQIDPIEKEIQKVLDILPDLEVEFIRKLLSRYDDTELAIAAYLEGNIPPDLDSQIKEPSNGKQINDKAIKLVSETMAAIGIDENTQITSKHIKSKAIKPKAEKRFLDDKSNIKEFHERNVTYGYVSEDEDDANLREYDDEYDDSYDAMIESESKSVARALKGNTAINEIADEESEESDGSNGEDTSGQRDKSRDFCENPEAARERWARNRDAKYASKRPQQHNNK